MPFTDYVSLAARLMEAGGVLVMLLGPPVALALGARLWHEGGAVVYRSFREYLGRAILLGLELLVAADIIRTVGEAPTLERALALAVVVAIRTTLSFTLQVELEGHWPWQRGR